MDPQQLWQNYKELILIVVTALVTLFVQSTFPTVWKQLIGLGRKLWSSIGGWLSVAAFKKRYLEQLREEQRFLQIRGISTRSPVAVELEKVYVDLSLNSLSRDRLRDRGEGEEILEERARKGMRPEPDFRLDVQAKEPERISVGEVLKRYGNRLVFLGGPGTGKTTLLGYLALAFAKGEAKKELGLEEDRLPILILLRELPRKKRSLTMDNLPELCTAREIARDCPEGFFKERLDEGGCIVLLDGIDEVPTEGERSDVARQIDDFVSTYPNNRFVVTSRPAGYNGVALAGFTVLDICDFSDEDVEAFAEQWCLAVELATRGGKTSEAVEAVARRNAEREAEQLVAVIRAKEEVRRLTVNPLLLTIVAMVHRYRATLPERRVELYDECTEVLLGYWDEAKGIAGQLDWSRKRSVLIPLAYEMHRQRRREMESVEVEKLIAGTLPNVGEKGEKAGEFLKSVRERSGLLMERGLGIYGFSHLTFQEYLTALHLFERGAEGRRELLGHLHDSWWREVTLLYAGLGDATDLIKDILSGREDLFKSNLFLAAYCLEDAQKSDPLVQEEVVSQLVREFRAGAFKGLRDEAHTALVAVGRGHSTIKVLEGLIRLLGDENPGVRGRAASALGQIGRSDPGVVEGLIRLLGDENPGVRLRAASALGQIGRSDPGVVEGLIRLLGDENPGVRGRAADALLYRLQIDAQNVPILREYLQDTREVEFLVEGLVQVRDVAWRLLRQYSQRTETRIYTVEGGA
jgi:predicted NACHT family NTPase